MTESAAGGTTVRILLVDDHPIMREGLTMLIGRREGFEVVGHAGNGADALALAARERPDVILLDVDLGGESGLDLLPRLSAAAPAADVIVLTGVRAPETPQRALLLGAKGLVLKDTASEVLLKAIEKVRAGEVWFDRAVMQRVIAKVSGAGGERADREAAKIAALTAREREIVALIGEGLRNEKIAERLFISEKTVRNHLTTIFTKLEVEDRLGLVVYAYRHGLAKPRA